MLYIVELMTFCCVNAQTTRIEELVKTSFVEKVEQMISYISLMANKQTPRETRLYYRTKALDSFIGSGNSYTVGGITNPPVQMEVTSVRTGRKTLIPMSNYFSNLININYINVNINYSKPTNIKVSGLQQIEEGLYKCTVQYEQTFQGNKDNNSQYTDKIVKRAVCYLKKRQTNDGDEYVILLGDIHSMNSETFN